MLDNRMANYLMTMLEEIDSYERPHFYDAMMDELHAQKTESMATKKSNARLKLLKHETTLMNMFLAEVLECYPDRTTGNRVCDSNPSACDRCHMKDMQDMFKEFKSMNTIR